MSVPRATVPNVGASIDYVRGDATTPLGKGPKVIAHVCNDRGGWGKGFVLALSKRWPEPEAAYRRWYRERSGNDFGLGAVQIVPVQPGMWVANMVGQHGTRTGSHGPPVRYQAISTPPWPTWLSTRSNWAPRCTCRASAAGWPVGAGSASNRWSSNASSAPASP
jgi:hypothetical protein